MLAQYLADGRLADHLAEIPAAAGSSWESSVIWPAIACEKDHPMPEKPADFNAG